MRYTIYYNKNSGILKARAIYETTDQREALLALKRLQRLAGRESWRYELKVRR